MEKERTDFLWEDGYKLTQSKDVFPFGTDSLILSDFAKCKKTDRVIDLGTGTGVIPLLIYAKYKPKEIVGIDNSEKAIELAKRNIIQNSLDNIIKIQKADIKNLPKALADQSFDLAVTNPPYYKYKSGYESKDEEISKARHEKDCNIDDITAAAEKLLKFGGRLCLIYPPERMTDVLVSMRNAKIEPKIMRLVISRAGLTPNLMLVEGKKGAKPGLKNMPPLLLYKDETGYTDEFKEMYINYK